MTSFHHVTSSLQPDRVQLAPGVRAGGWHNTAYIIITLLFFVQDVTSLHNCNPVSSCCDDWGWEQPESLRPWLLPHLDVFLQLAQSWANLHWSACLCAILASSSSQIWTHNIESLATSSLQFWHIYIDIYNNRSFFFYSFSIKYYIHVHPCHFQQRGEIITI